MAKHRLEFIVFVSGAVVMVLELVGSRMVAPYFGTSIYVWTSLIGVILASLSLGYFWGGRLADRRADYRTLARLLFWAGVCVFLAAIFNPYILGFLEKTSFDPRMKAVLASIILLGPPSVLLGTVSPYAVRLRIEDIKTSGSTVGNLYAVSTVGSIVGTFLAGFALIAYLGTARILFVLAVSLVLLSFIAYSEWRRLARITVFLLTLGALYGVRAWEAALRHAGFVDVDTPYNRVWIVDEQKLMGPGVFRPVRTMLLDGKGNSATFLDGDELVYDYTKFYRLGKHFRPDLSRALMLGGGGYSYPKDYLAMFPEATLDVVEIDPGMTDLARTYFNLRDNPRLAIYHEDGRTFLNRTRNTYQAILGDAFGNYYSIPYQLTTKEAVRRMYDILDDDGVVILNIISSIEGEKGKFLRAEYRTFRTVFPQVYLFPVLSKTGTALQNVMLVALKSPGPASFTTGDQELQGYLNRRWEGEVPEDLPVLTDDYAPVDQYIAELL